MAYTREEIEAEIKRRGLKVPQYSRDEIAAEMKRRGLAVPEATISQTKPYLAG